MDNTNIGVIPVLAVSRMDWHLAVKLLRWMAILDAQSIKHFPLIVHASPALKPLEMWALADACRMNRGTVCVAEGVVEKGYFGTPNQMFLTAIESIEKAYPHAAMLWLEADCVPLKPDWLYEIAEEYHNCGKPFMGDFVKGGQIPHMTGVAVYHPNWRKLAPSLTRITKHNPTQGWDSQCAHELVPQAHESKTIQQIWRPEPFTKSSQLRSTATLFHQCKDGTLIDVLSPVPIPLHPPLEESTYEREKSQYGDEHLEPNDRPRKQPLVKPAVSMEIFIVTFKRDMDFMRYLMQGLNKYAKDFAGITVAFPKYEYTDWDWLPRRVNRVPYDEIPGKGMMCHEREIMRADIHCPEATHILHLDADCMPWDTFTPKDFLPDGKVLSVLELYSKIGNPNRHLWRKAVDKCTGIDPTADFMVRHPQVHVREVYELARKQIERWTGRSWEESVLSSPDSFPQTFCEFNVLGAVAHKQLFDRYKFVEYEKALDKDDWKITHDNWQYSYRWGRDKIIECWSHGGIERYRLWSSSNEISPHRPSQRADHASVLARRFLHGDDPHGATSQVARPPRHPVWVGGERGTVR
jgi:hypothetical protein